MNPLENRHIVCSRSIASVPYDPVAKAGLPQNGSPLHPIRADVILPRPAAGGRLGQNGFEQVPGPPLGAKVPVLELGEAPGDGEAQAAPSVFREASPRDKALREFIGGDNQRFRRDVAEGDGHLLIGGLAGEIHPRARLGVLLDVAEEILKHPPQQTAVGGDVGVPSAGVRQRSAVWRPGAPHIPGGLAQEDVHVRGLEVDGQVACGGFGGFH